MAVRAEFNWIAGAASLMSRPQRLMPKLGTTPITPKERIHLTNIFMGFLFRSCCETCSAVFASFVCVLHTNGKMAFQLQWRLES
jgi:hypothetical protein